MQPDIKYYLAEETVDREDIKALIDWLGTNPRMTMGNLTVEFEKKWSKWLGRKYSVYCNSGSSANLLMYYSLLISGRLKNKKVVVPSVGWPTTISPAIQLGFEPIMCEADRETFGLDLGHLEEILKEHQPSTVIMVQVLGVPHKMNQLLALKKEYDFFLLEDACAAMGSSYRGKKVGTFGEMSSFSLYFGHQISTVEGGLVSTDDPDLYEQLVMLRSHGWKKELDKEKYWQLIEAEGDTAAIEYMRHSFKFHVPGFNFRPTDIGAFIGIRQVDKMEWLIKRRVENHQTYYRNLGGYFYTQRTGQDIGNIACTIHFGMLASNKKQRDRIIAALVKNRVETRHFAAGNLGRHPFWEERYGKKFFPVADMIHDCGLFIPNNPSLNEADANFISNIILECLKKNEEVGQ